MVGLTKEQVLSCMGLPQQAAAEGQTEVWSYMSGGETEVHSNSTSSSFIPGIVSGYESAYESARYCIVDIVMTQGRVARVNYRWADRGGAIQGQSVRVPGQELHRNGASTARACKASATCCGSSCSPRDGYGGAAGDNGAIWFRLCLERAEVPLRLLVSVARLS